MREMFEFGEDMPIALQIKELDENELLDFWEHIQQVENMIKSEFNQDVMLSPDYEKMIVTELQLRLFQSKIAAMGEKNKKN